MGDNLSLYGGLGGIAFAAAEVGRVTETPRLEGAASRLFAAIAAASPNRGGGGWGEVNDVIAGAAGVGLVLLRGFERLGDPVLLDAAVEIGDTLIARAEVMSGGRMRWMRGTETPFDLPNFSHGTAGVGLFMSHLASVTDAERFSDAAVSATRYLDSIANPQEDLFLVPYGVPNEGFVTPFDIGWAHGPAGTGRLYYSRWLATQDEGMLDRLARNARTVLASGVPETSSDTLLWKGPFNLDRRFGMAGIVPFLIDFADEAGQESFSLAALEIADHILERATRNDGGLYWRSPLYGFQGDDGDAVFTGYFYGTAGLGLAMLEAHFASSGRRPAIRFPDDPFPEQPGG